MQRLRTELRDLAELAVVPAAGALLPWRTGFVLLKQLARWSWLYRGSCAQALEQAQARGVVPPGQEDAWARQRRLVTLVDHADHYLARTRSDRFMDRHLQVMGNWPNPGVAGICLTFHWGAGMWALRHAAANGLRAHALVAAMEGDPFDGRAVLRRYAVARTRSVQNALGRPPLVVTDSLRPVVRALRKGEQVFAAVDVPPDRVSASVPVQLQGMPARMPRGLLRLAVDMQIPVTVYSTGFEPATGQRQLRIVPLGVHSDVQTLAETVFAELDALLAEHSAFWHFWSEAPRIFTDR
ncbi:hypothetical protein [Pulveribacter sp.]|uniref:hypothetical protein n=1 Tax=Pulveribacter sp. TaxID=2678893 RepID=UPI0028AC3674|nr:hypothetical protein [Pulveribacter sp.]